MPRSVSAAEQAELAELRELILGVERRRLEGLERRLDSETLTRESLVDLLPDAIALRAGRDRQLARALTPTIETAIAESVRRNPRPIATAIFPVLGPAIRKAIAEALAGLVSSINRAIDHSISPRGLRWRLEAWRTGVPYAEIVLRRALVYRVEQAFLIHGDTGLMIAHAVAPDLPGSNPDLISGMLTAIRDFVGDSFSRERDAGGLRRFSVGELTVMVEQGPHAMIAAVARGEAPETLVVQLQDALERIHLEFAGPLAAFDGDTAPLAAVQPLVEECLVTVVATDRDPAARRVRWVPWALAALLLLLVLGGLAFNGRMRWNRAVAQLRSQPGIVLTHATREGGQWQFSGLRDPLSPDPSALLAGVGVDVTEVQQRWEPYLSLQPELILARARRMLSPPANVALALEGDVLRASGAASLEWLASARRLSASIPGVSAINLRGVRPEIPPATKNEIEAERVLFEVGSAVLGPEALRAADVVSERFARVAADASTAGNRASLELLGRTDPSGSDAANEALSQSRGEAVLAALAARGVPRSATIVSALGTTRPLDGDDPEERARINRSVSFRVSVAP